MEIGQKVRVNGYWGEVTGIRYEISGRYVKVKTAYNEDWHRYEVVEVKEEIREEIKEGRKIGRKKKISEG